MPLLRLPLLRSSWATPRPWPLRTFVSAARLAQAQPSILSCLQSDLKSALRAKDKQRLTVLRSLLAEKINASKTGKPIATDGHLLTLLQKQIKAANTAVEEFVNAKREDLVEKERGQRTVLQEYVDRIDVVGKEEIDGVVKSVKEALGNQAKVGRVMGQVLSRLGGRPVDADLVRRRVEEAEGLRRSDE